MNTHRKKIVFGLAVLSTCIWYMYNGLYIPMKYPSLETDENSKYYPLLNMLATDGNLSFLYLTKRHRRISYSELTTADTDASDPLYPDFTWLLDYRKDHVILFEDQNGPGCVCRFYLESRETDSSKALIVYDIDGVKYTYKWKEHLQGKTWPFMSPINTNKRNPYSGSGSYIPVCYKKSLIISFFPVIGKDLDIAFDTNIKCTRQENILPCPVKIYGSYSHMKLPPVTDVEIFSGNNRSLFREKAETLNEVLKKPQEHGPDLSTRCHLKCLTIKHDTSVEIFHSNESAVITSIKVRVQEKNSNQIRQDWTDVLLTAVFDGATEAQINKVPLGNLFGVTGSLNKFTAATFGKTNMNCESNDGVLNNGTDEITGYLYYPMPFWRKAHITLEGTKFIEKPLKVCYQITTIPNSFTQKDTGYFHAHRTYYNENVTGWREVLSVEGSWGQVVAILMDFENIYMKTVAAHRRWAAVEADNVIYIDGSKSASVMGTGYEDYLSYAHVFDGQENTTYAFVGNYHASYRRQPRTRHSYRLHLVDPIIFSDSLHFIMEGTSLQYFQRKQPSLDYTEYTERRKLGKSGLSHLALYYKGTNSGLRRTDVLYISKIKSESEHKLTIQSSRNHTGDIFHVNNVRYIGAYNKDELLNASGRSFKPGDKIQFTLKCLKENHGVLLRREFHSLPVTSWNERAHITINGYDLYQWFIPKGALTDVYSLRQEDFHVDQLYTENEESLRVQIEVLTQWRDISYTAYSIV